MYLKQAKIFVALLLCLTVVFSLIPKITYASNNINVSKKFSIMEKNGKNFKLKGEQENVEAILTMDKENQELTLATNEESKKTTKKERNYKVIINDIKNDSVVATFIDTETNEVYHIDQTKKEPSFAFLVPIGVVIGEWLLAQLIAAATAVTIGGIVYTVATEVAETLKKEKYNHYAAKIMQGKIWLGPALSLDQAVSRFIGFDIYNRDVWSTKFNYAWQVAYEAGGKKTPVGPETSNGSDDEGIYWPHYHTWNRVGGHSFYNL